MNAAITRALRRVTPHGSARSPRAGCRQRAVGIIGLCTSNQHEPRPPMKRYLILLLLLAMGISSISSCLPLAAGAAAGYVAHKEGYRFRSPVIKH